MARRHHRQDRGSAWSGLFGLLLILAVGYTVTEDMKPLVNRLTMSDSEREAIELSVTYAGCREAQEAGAAPIYLGQPGYRTTMDGDGDGIACEGY